MAASCNRLAFTWHGIFTDFHTFLPSADDRAWWQPRHDVPPRRKPSMCSPSSSMRASVQNARESHVMCFCRVGRCHARAGRREFAAGPASCLSDASSTLVQLDQLGSGQFSAGLTRRKVLTKLTRFFIVRFPPTTNGVSWGVGHAGGK